MLRALVVVLSAAALFAAEDSWSKVKELKSGTEVQVYCRGIAKPLEAKLDDVRDDALVIVVKNQQRSIPKEEIDRLDYRPKRQVTSEVQRGVKVVGEAPAEPVNRSQSGYSGGVKFTKRPYENIYRRP